MGITEVLAKMGISAAALVPSFIGASLRTVRDEGKNFWEHVIGVISGVATAAFLTPFFIQVAGMPEQSEAGIGFGLGYMGLSVVEAAMEYLKKKK